MQLNYVKKIHVFLNAGSLLIFESGYILVIIVLSYHWGVGRELEYSPSIVLLSIGTLMSIASIPSFMSGIEIILKLNAVFTRINEVMSTKDKQTDFTKPNEYGYFGVAVVFENVTASWGFKIKQDIYSGKAKVITDEPTDNLEFISFEAHEQDFIAVVGPVGSGKTTLLNAIMNELEVSEGNIKVSGSISYVEQEPFITSDTVQNNILFGKKFDEEKLNKVIELC